MSGVPPAPEIDGIEGLHLIGEGGFATVYRGHQTTFRRDVAVKLIRRSSIAGEDRLRFERECQAMGAVSGHPAIVTLYDAGFTDDGSAYLVMAYVEGGTLSHALADDGPMSWQEVTALGVRLADALETAHRAGVLHRDIKPANVLRSKYGAQLSDFGIARIEGGHETRAGLVTATIAHAAPEILDGAPPSATADVYSLASTLHEALTGRSPFAGDPHEGLPAHIRRVMLEAPPDLRARGVHDQLATVLEQALSKDPADRHPTAASFGHALRGVQTALGLRVTDMTTVDDVDIPSVAATSAAVADLSDAYSTPVRPASADPVPPAAPPAPGASPPVESSPPRPTAADRPPAEPATAPGPPPAPAADALDDGSGRDRNRLVLAMVVLGAVALVVGLLVLANRSGDSSDRASAPIDSQSDPNTGTAVPEPGATDAQVSTPAPASTVAPTTAAPTTVTPTTEAVAAGPLILPPGDDLTLQLWHPGRFVPSLEALVDTFEAANPGISIELTAGQTYSGLLETAVATDPDELPDMLLVADRGVQRVLDTLDIVPVQTLIDRDGFDATTLLPAAVDRYATPDGLAAMPFNVSVPVVYSNESVLAAAGVELADREAWSVSDLLDACDALAPLVTTCIEYDNPAWLFEGLLARGQSLYLDQANGRTGPATEVVYDEEPNGRAAFDVFVEFHTTGAGVERTGTPQFFDGESAFYITSNGALRWIDDNVSQLDPPFEIGGAWLPSTNPGDSGVPASGGAIWVLDSGDDRRAIASWLFLKHFLDAEEQFAFHDATGYVPVRSDMVDDPVLTEFWEEHPPYRTAYDQLLASRPGPDAPASRGARTGPLHDIDWAVLNAVRDVTTGESSPDDAFDTMITESDAILAAYPLGSDGG